VHDRAVKLLPSPQARAASHYPVVVLLFLIADIVKGFMSRGKFRAGGQPCGEIKNQLLRVPDISVFEVSRFRENTFDDQTSCTRNTREIASANFHRSFFTARGAV
jgi:hypothetical protein